MIFYCYLIFLSNCFAATMLEISDFLLNLLFSFYDLALNMVFILGLELPGLVVLSHC
jgi:hypothetical protein